MTGHRVTDWTTRNHNLETFAMWRGRSRLFHRHLCILNIQEEMAYHHFFKWSSALTELMRSFHKVYSPSLALWSYEVIVLSHHRSLDSPSRLALRWSHILYYPDHYHLCFDYLVFVWWWLVFFIAEIEVNLPDLLLGLKELMCAVLSRAG